MECTIKECFRIPRARGLCRTHYRRYLEGTDLESPIQPHKNYYKVTTCEIINCNRPSLLTGSKCRTCRNRLKRGGPEQLPLKTFEFIDSSGYVRWNKSHPDNDSNGVVFAHRKLMEISIGRALLKTENVHHINGQKDDNRLENLELWSTSQPRGQRIEDKVSWALEILDLYGDGNYNNK